MYQEQLLFIIFSTCIVASQSLCDRIASVNITDGIRQGNDIVKDSIVYDEENYFSDDGTVWGCICNIKRCVRKCCGTNQKVVNKTCVINDEEFQIDIFNGTQLSNEYNLKDFFFVFSDKCRKNHVRIYPDSSEDIFVQQNGSLLVKSFETVYGIEDYCIDTFANRTFAYVCEFYLPPKDVTVLGVGMIISMPFLFITFLVYFILPERNVHRRALMNYVLSLLCGYISLVTVQLFKNETKPLPDLHCHMIGYSIIFFFIVSFFWMNVMCIDMWLAFSGLRRFSGRKNAEQKKFIFFCIYAWGVPALLILLIFLMNTYADEKAIYHPHLGTAKCFLEEGYPNLFYFYLPMAILITVNIILCILTAVRIQTVKKETSMLKHGDSKRHSYENDKQKFKLYIKLIFAMGINWSMEVISWVIIWQWNNLPTYIWYLTDFANAAYGVFIFFIFVFKKNVWVQLKKRYYIWRGQPHLAHTLSSTQNTRTSNFSTADSITVSADYRLNDLKTGRFEEKPLSVR